MPPRQADAIVILGCKLRVDGQASGQLCRRVALGVRLYKEGVAPVVLLAGGGAPVSEAEAMRDLAVAAGVPQSALICEKSSRNTAENAVYGARLLREGGRRRVVLVSHRTHLFRARLLFRLAGIVVIGSAGVPPRSAIEALKTALYETAAVPHSIARLLWRGRQVKTPY